MKNLSKKTKIIILSCAVSALLALVLLLIFGKGGSDPNAPTAAHTPAPDQAVYDLSTAPITKEETVYVNLAPDGTLKKVSVTDRIHSDMPQVRVEDKSNLKDINDVKTFIAPVIADGRMYWDMPSTDLYYNGSTDSEPPLSVSVKYSLDGKSIGYDELAGKSGKVTIDISVKNSLTQTVDLDGSSYTIKCPMLLLCGMLLSDDKFDDVKADDGIILGDGTHKLVFFMGVPGMNESLGLDELGLPFLSETLGGSHYSMSAVTDSFSLGNMMLVAVPFSSVRTLGMKDIPESIEGLKSMLTDIDELMEAFSSMDIEDVIDVLYGDAEKIEKLINAVADASQLYEDNKALVEVLNRFATDGNLQKLEKVLADMEKLNTDRIKALTDFAPFSTLISLMGTLDKNLREISNFTKDYRELEPIITSLNKDLQRAEIQNALDDLPETLSKLRNLVSLLKDSEGLISKASKLLNSDSLQKIMSFTRVLRDSDSLNALSSAQEKSLAGRTKAWLGFGESYDIFTQKTENTSSSVVFIYKTEAIG